LLEENKIDYLNTQMSWRMSLQGM